MRKEALLFRHRLRVDSTSACHNALPIRLAPILNAGDVDGCVFVEIEEHAIISASQPESSVWRPELLHVSSAASQIAIHAIEDLHCDFAINGP